MQGSVTGRKVAVGSAFAVAHHEQRLNDECMTKNNNQTAHAPPTGMETGGPRMPVGGAQ
jgi:hypothetical protein